MMACVLCTGFDFKLALYSFKDGHHFNLKSSGDPCFCHIGFFLVFFVDQVDKCLVEESSDHQVHHSLRRHLILSVMLHLANFHCKKMDIDWYMSI